MEEIGEGEGRVRNSGQVYEKEKSEENYRINVLRRGSKEEEEILQCEALLM